MSEKVNSEKSLGQEQQSSSTCSRRTLANRWKQLLGISFLVVVIIGLVVDTILRSCSIVEKEEARTLRLFCDDLLETVNGTLVNNTNFFCSNPNATESDFTLSVQDGVEVCTRQAACVELGLTVFIDWIEDNVVAGFFATSLVYAIASVLLVPGSILTLGSGAAFGTALGLGVGVAVGALSVWLGASAGALISFLLGKYLLRDFTEILINKYKVIRAIDSSLGDEGFKITLLLRFSPIVPFSATNYVMGATSCSFRNYSLATILGIFPGTVAYVFIGAAIAAAATGGLSTESMALTQSSCENTGADVVTIVVLVIGSLATFVAVVLIGKYSRQKFQSYVEEENDGKEDGENAVAPTETV